jgi:hypothetical protein
MEHEGQSLDELLNGEPIADVVEADPVETAPAQPEDAERPSDGPARGPDGKFIPKQETGVEPQPETGAETVPPTDKLPKEDYKAIREEREKRQRLEAELEAIKQQLQQQQQPKEPPAPPPSIWDDDQAWQQHFQRQVMQQADQLSRINASEMAARAQHPDFQDMFDLFNKLASENPSVVQQAMADPHPWNKAYQIAKNHKSMQELGATNLDELRAKLREEILAEQQQAQPVPGQVLPPTLSTERNVGTRTGPEWSGPKPLDQLLR